VRGTEPIIVEYSGGRNRVAVKFWTDAESQLKKGDVENARRSVDAAIRSDPTLWPALYTRAKIFIRQH
jgi:Tfp pilus assembly protein PilF